VSQVPELHIASLVVHALPSRLPQVSAAIAALPGACVHGNAPNGKLVVTLEAPGAALLLDAVARIQAFDGVLSAALVYQCADTLEAMNEDMPDADCTPRLH